MLLTDILTDKHTNTKAVFLIAHIPWQDFIELKRKKSIWEEIKFEEGNPRNTTNMIEKQWKWKGKITEEVKDASVEGRWWIGDIYSPCWALITVSNHRRSFVNHQALGPWLAPFSMLSLHCDRNVIRWLFSYTLQHNCLAPLVMRK